MRERGRLELVIELLPFGRDVLELVRVAGARRRFILKPRDNGALAVQQLERPLELFLDGSVPGTMTPYVHVHLPERHSSGDLAPGRLALSVVPKAGHFSARDEVSRAARFPIERDAARLLQSKLAAGSRRS